MSDKINKIETELSGLKATLNKYRALFKADGTIDANEQDQLDSMMRLIDRLENKLTRMNRRADRKEDRQERRAERKENRQERRAERKEDRQERRAERKEDRKKSRDAKQISADEDQGPLPVTKETKKKFKIEYKEVVADLFVKGKGDDNAIDPNDVKQGYLGDCYFLAAIQAIAQSNPSALKKLIKDNKDGTYEVTLYVYKYLVSWNRSPIKITVDTNVPHVKGTIQPVYAGKGDNELWVLLLEKAYAVYEGSYGDIEGGNHLKPWASYLAKMVMIFILNECLRKC